MQTGQRTAESHILKPGDKAAEGVRSCPQVASCGAGNGQQALPIVGAAGLSAWSHSVPHYKEPARKKIVSRLFFRAGNGAGSGRSRRKVMTETEFWKYIEDAHSDAEGDTERQSELLVERLSALPEAEIIDFERHFNAREKESYNWNLWGAAYLINGGCSDDGFDYFRGWLIAQGRTVFENALKDPDTLADVVTLEEATEGDVEAEEMLYVAMYAYQKRTGREIYDDMEHTPVSPMPPEPGGEAWEDDAELDNRYPRLAALVQEGYEVWKSRQTGENAAGEEDDD
jgi:hypothetical protein